ncbi:hypothetical protein ACWODC_11295 [Enterococcus raffinosus]
MNYKKLLCSVMLLGSLGSSAFVAYGEETSNLAETQESTTVQESSSSIAPTKKQAVGTSETQESVSKKDEESTLSSEKETEESSTDEESMIVDEEEYDAQGNLQFSQVQTPV